MRKTVAMKNTTNLKAGFAQFTSILPCDELVAGFHGKRSLWATDSGYFYQLMLLPTQVSSKKFVTETMLAAAEVIKGDLDTNVEDFQFSRKCWVTFAALTPDTLEDEAWSIYLDGYWLDAFTYTFRIIVVSF